MKVVIVNKSVEGGGAAVAALRLFNALKSNGTDVHMLVQNGTSNEANIHSLSVNRNARRKAFQRFINERLYFLPFEKNKNVRFTFSPAVSGIDISEHPIIQEADVIHLHWINHGFLSLSNLKQLFALKKPIVWTMHDMWPFTGGCHYAGVCSNYIDHCGNCVFLRWSHPNDLSARIHKRKLKIWDKAQIHAVSCSQWLGSLAQHSSLLRKHNISSIPNPINTAVFKPKDKTESRKSLGLPLDKKLLLFGAANIADPRKGSRFLKEAVQHLNLKHPELKDEIELVIFGKSRSKCRNEYPYKAHYLSFISSTEQMVDLYNAADASILPSLQDNLPNTVMEALSCGTPSVCFSVGGVPEMIQHQKTGYLAMMENSIELAEGIHYVLYNENRNNLGENARKFVLENYSHQVISEKYTKVYESAIANFKANE